MKSEILTGFGLNVEHLKQLLKDVPGDRMCEQPMPGVANHAAWTLGHLTFSLQAIAGELGVHPFLPSNYRELFAPGSKPHADPKRYPIWHELLKTFDMAEARNRKAIDECPDLKAELPDEAYRKILPTVGHALNQILLGHFGYHVGQLAVWVQAIDIESNAWQETKAAYESPSRGEENEHGE